MGAATLSLPAHLDSLAGVKVVDASPRMVLVDASRAVITQAMKQIDGWEIVPETLTPLPDTRAKLRR